MHCSNTFTDQNNDYKWHPNLAVFLSQIMQYLLQFEDSLYLILVGVWCFRPEYQDIIRKPAQQWQNWRKLTISVLNLIPFQLSASLKKYPQAKVQNSFLTIDIRKEAKANLTKDICMNLDISWDNCSKIGRLITEELNTLEG